jgi:hypothetical protein
MKWRAQRAISGLEKHLAAHPGDKMAAKRLAILKTLVL